MSLKGVQQTWEQIGSDDPLWGVLSWEGTEHGRWNIEEFFAQGEREIATFLREAEALGLNVNRGVALDFGCGVGRLTQALASRFDRIHGIDISAPMIDYARRLAGDEYPQCEFQVSASRRLPLPSSGFDLVVSNIVLQHMPTKLAAAYVTEFIRVLRPGGVAIFQMPSHQLSGSRSSNVAVRLTMNALPSQWREEILRRRGSGGPRDLPMHGIPRGRMLRHVERNGGKVVACVEDGAAGRNWRSFHYFVAAAEP